MAAKTIRIDTSRLNHTRMELQGKLSRIRNDIESISGNLDGLNSMWEGEAHETFDKRIKEDIHFLSQVCGNLQGLINFESEAVAEYDSCEQQVAEIISQVRI